MQKTVAQAWALVGISVPLPGTNTVPANAPIPTLPQPQPGALLRYFALLMTLKPTWRTATEAFLEVLDLLAAAPAIASAMSDTTTTDPTSSDPSFKAGKDL